MNTLSTFVKEHYFFKGFSEEELEFTIHRCFTKHFRAGEFLIQEHDTLSDIYILVEGSVEMLKEVEGATEPLMIGKIESGEVIGELSYLDNRPRSVSIRALEDTSILIIPKSMTEEKNSLAQTIENKIHYNIARLSSERLRCTSSSYSESLKKQIDLLQEQVHFGTLFVYMIILFGMNGFVLDIIQNHFGKYYFFEAPTFNLFYERIISWIGFIIFAIPVFILIKKINFPIKNVLALRTNLRRSFSEGVLISALFVIPVLLITTGIIGINSFPVMNDKVTPYWLLTAFTPDYFFHSYIQELVARGIMQNAVQQFLRDERGHKTIMVSALAFGVMHAHLGLAAVLATALGSIGFGYVYLRHKNLVGVTIIHYSTGALMRYVNILRLFQ